MMYTNLLFHKKESVFGGSVINVVIEGEKKSKMGILVSTNFEGFCVTYVKEFD